MRPFCRSGQNTARQLGELAAARALAWLLKARQNSYYAPEVEQRYQDAGELAEMAVERFSVELFILGEGQDPIAFATDVVRGAIAAVFIESAPAHPGPLRKRCSAFSAAPRLRLVSRRTKTGNRPAPTLPV
jgi:hypothetical protein